MSVCALLVQYSDAYPVYYAQDRRQVPGQASGKIVSILMKAVFLNPDLFNKPSHASNACMPLPHTTKQTNMGCCQVKKTTHLFLSAFTCLQHINTG